MSEVNYKIELEPYEDFHFIHLDVYVWTPATFKRIRRALQILEEQFELRVAASVDNAKLLKFSKMLGYEPTYTEVSPNDGKEYLILTRRR